MKAYSIDLRRKIVESYDQGDKTQSVVSERFGVSVSFGEKLLRRRRIRVESEVGRGSEFHFTVSLGSQKSTVTTASWSAESERFSPASERHSQHLKILLAEDNRINQVLALIMLEAWGHQIVVANHGEEALDKLENEQFDLILMDVQMPKLDGVETTKTIRTREPLRGESVDDGHDIATAEMRCNGIPDRG